VESRRRQLEQELGGRKQLEETVERLQKQSADEIIERCLRLGVKVIAGGPLFTAHPEQNNWAKKRISFGSEDYLLTALFNHMLNRHANNFSLWIVFSSSPRDSIKCFPKFSFVVNIKHHPTCIGLVENLRRQDF
jgi:hypothetical protein